MNYSNADFIRLMTEIEDQGGEHLDETCGGQEYEYTMQDGTVKTHFTAGCENETMFHVAYDPYATVMVPEPVLEPDPEREGRSHRAKLEPDPSDKTFAAEGRKQRMRPIVVLIERRAEVPAGVEEQPSVVRTCAGHDSVGLWPRFAHVVKDGPV
jgi:hypothetical protein